MTACDQKKDQLTSYQTPNDGPHVEDSPEPGEIVALFMLVGIGNHNGALGRPEQAGADAQEHAGKDVEARDIGVDRGEQAGGVDAVADASKGEGVLDAELVDKGAAEETKDGKRAVQGRVLCNATTVSGQSVNSADGRGHLDRLTMLSARVASVLPPPPMPPRALNMPGHRKQTNDTMMSWVWGEAYHGMLKPKIRRCLYFHPAGRGTSTCPSAAAAAAGPWSTAWSAGTVVSAGFFSVDIVGRQLASIDCGGVVPGTQSKGERGTAVSGGRRLGHEDEAQTRERSRALMNQIRST